MRSLVTAALGLAFALPVATGCAYEEPSDDATLEIPLVQVGNDGLLYRLQGRFDITRPDGSVFAVTTGDEPELALTLDPGLHTVELADGWSLARQGSDQVYRTVPAILGSINPTVIRVVPNRSVGIGFQFFVRETTGTLSISFGVTPAPHQLSAGLRFNAGTGVFAEYAGQRVDLQLYFDQAVQTLVAEADGSLARRYETGLNALEIYNDNLGLVAPVAAAFTGGWLELTTRIKPDGVGEFQASYWANDGSTLTFAPSTDAAVEAGPDGYPADAFFYATGSAVELTTADGTVSGPLTSIRYFQ
jgi:hypothetical protein